MTHLDFHEISILYTSIFYLFYPISFLFFYLEVTYVAKTFIIICTVSIVNNEFPSSSYTTAMISYIQIFGLMFLA